VRLAKLAVISAFGVGAAAGPAIGTLWETPAQAPPKLQPPAIGPYQPVPMPLCPADTPYPGETSTREVGNYDGALRHKAWAPGPLLLAAGPGAAR